MSRYSTTIGPDDYNTLSLFSNNQCNSCCANNQSGVTGLHLSLHQFERFDGMTREQSFEIAESLFEFVTQDKYCYFHEWQDGDVSMSDQWLGVHKRLHFESMDNRLTNNCAFSIQKIESSTHISFISINIHI